ncbi:MAG TPA: phosphodiester glycosidase family protein [Pseudonocardiaceae bacterium]|nr:phosphodiester glycosidase family protein [Pseudonocardiaceae bacterium]
MVTIVGGGTLAAAGTAAAASPSWLPATPAGWNLVVDRDTTPAMTVTRGVTERSETLDTVSGRQHTQVMDVDLTDPNVRLGVVEAGGTLTDPADETVGSMATRTHAVAGINGDYFEIHASGRPLGGVVTDGQLLKSPRPDYNAQLTVRADGSMAIGPESYSGTVTDQQSSSPLASVNVVNDVVAGGITRVTPALGATGQLASPAVLVTGHTVAGGLVVDGIQTSVTSVPAGTTGLLGAGAGGQWLTATVHAGDTLAISERISPDDQPRELLSGATMLVRDGAVYTDPTGTPPSGVNPETAVGLSKDGRHAIIVTLDGRFGETTAVGVGPAQVAGYLVQRGAYSALLLDGGGSTEMVAREPGTAGVSVLNTPSDGVQRPVANGLFVYSTETTAGPARSVVVNGGRPVTTVPGATVPVPVYATDQADDPAAVPPSVTVFPPSLADWTNGELTVHHAGQGELVARDGGVVATAPLRVVDRLASLAVSPNQPDLTNGATQAFTLAATTASGQAQVSVPAAAARWTVDRPELGSVSADGVFTAAAQGAGLVTVTATVGGRTSSASVAVGSDSQLVSDLTDVANWRLRNTTGAPATLGLAAGVVPPGSTGTGSLQLTYTVPAGAGVKQLVFWDTNDIVIGPKADGADPTAIGLWVDGDRDGLTLHEQYVQINGQAAPLAETQVTWQGWRFDTAQIPPGTQFPITMDYLDFLAINPSTTVSGTLDVGGLQALYSPRPVVTPPYVAVPNNPNWLQYKESTTSFSPAGTTVLTGDDAHLLAGDPASASGNVFKAIAARGLSPAAAQFLGDMSDDGLPADLAYARSTMASLGVPFRDAVGNHEISQGALPENGNFTADFGATHYAYQVGGAQWIVTDSAHGGLLSSDQFGVPVEAQYPWLVAQLSAATSPAVVVVTHMPAYDPHPVADSQFTDRWEARMYVRLIQRYQQTHPGRHVIMLYGHARGFAEQVLDPLGQPTDAAHGGIPQLTVADLGMPAYAPADQGGFCNFALLHVTPSGDVQFTVEPVLSAITIAAPQASLGVGAHEPLAATGTAVGGDNLPVLSVPIADPASHVWSTSDPRVAAVDARTGTLTARHPGTAVVSVTSGGITATTTITVTGSVDTP